MSILSGVETVDWVWFEEELAYDNARLPQALIVTGIATGTPTYVAAGSRALVQAANEVPAAASANPNPIEADARSLSIGESYYLAGQNMKLRDAMEVAARLGGHSLPRFEIPTAVIRLGSRAPAALARAMGFPDDLGEVAKSSIGVTYWGSSAKAATELGYQPRDLTSGLRTTFDVG